MHWKIHKIRTDTMSCNLGPLAAEIWMDAARKPAGRLVVYDAGSRELLTELFETEQVVTEVEPALEEHFRIQLGDLLPPWEKRTLLFIAGLLPKHGFTHVEAWDEASDTEFDAVTADLEFLTEEGVLFRYGCRPGTVIDYQIHATAEQSIYDNGALIQLKTNETDMELTLTVKWTDGEKVIYGAEITGGHMVQAGSKIRLDTGVSHEISMSTAGEMFACDSEIALPFPQLPEERVMLDESWETEMDLAVTLPDTNSGSKDVPVPLAYHNTLTELIEDEVEPYAMIEVEGAGEVQQADSRIAVETSGNYQFEIREGYLMESTVRRITEIHTGNRVMETVVDLEIGYRNWRME